MPLDSRIQSILPAVTKLRHDIHQHPELGFDVHRTAKLVADQLRLFQCDEVVEGIGQTGVVGVIKGRKSDSGKTIGLRADMDALPILEKNNLPYCSVNTGRMHACGHDGHTAMLLGAAKVLAESRNFDGTVVLIFQPAEEGEGGGRAMVEDGMMDRFDVQEVYAMHNLPNMPVGSFGVKQGPIMAAADTFDIAIEGRGGHAALPHLCVDTNVVAAHIIIALQQIAARQVDPMESVVVSTTAVHSEGDSYNVIPQNVALRGTVRTLSAAVQDQAELWLRKLAIDTAQTYGAHAEVDYQRGYPATVNSANEAVFAQSVAEKLVGAPKVNGDVSAMMAGEDFSYMLNSRPGAFVFIGNGDSASLHHPQYNFNDDVLPYGCSYWLHMVEDALPIS